jgi:hypothetical protein
VIVGCYCLEAGVGQRDTEFTERAPNAGSRFSCDTSATIGSCLLCLKGNIWGMEGGLLGGIIVKRVVGQRDARLKE